MTADEVTKQDAEEKEYLPIRTYSYKGHTLTVFRTGDEEWFDAEDICGILGYVQYIAAVAGYVGKGDQKVITNPEKDKAVVCVNRRGLYCLIISCKWEKAQEFRDMVVHKALMPPGRNGGVTPFSDNDKMLANPEFVISVLMEMADEGKEEGIM